MVNKTINNEQGFVLITSLLMLVVLTIIGISATNTTTVELQISGNDKVAKQTFYQAEGGSQVGIELLEDNIDQVGFSVADIGSVHINTLDFYQNESTTAVDWNSVDAYLPSASIPRTDLIFRGATSLAEGNAIQMAAGYEGKGKAAGGGGAVRQFDVRARHLGPINSQATIHLLWNHRL